MATRKKGAPVEAPVVPKEILEQAKKALGTDKIRRASKCPVCGTEVTASAAEGLCWVCRRLKISAWRDTDIQMNAQE